MTGVKEEQAYRGPEGVVVKVDGGYFVQYRAVRQTTRGPKARRYGTLAGAIGWLRRNYKKLA